MDEYPKPRGQLRAKNLAMLGGEDSTQSVPGARRAAGQESPGTVFSLLAGSYAEGVTQHSPGCAADAATLGYVVKPLQGNLLGERRHAKHVPTQSVGTCE
jgi:hypothetical protein